MTNMIQSRTSIKEIMLYVLLIVFIGLPCMYAEPLVTTVEVSMKDSPDCDPKCGCDGMYSYNEVRDECVLNLHKLMKRVMVRYDNHNTDDILAENGMAKSIYIEGQNIFRGILISVILIMTCATICVLSACIYCCRMDYTDRKLKTEVKALAKKMNKTYKEGPKRKAAEPKSQSCNVVVEEAGVFVV